MTLSEIRELDPIPRLLLGPGPSPVHPRISRAMLAPVVGHLDPQFLKVLEETQELLRFVFQTRNALTLTVSGTGTAGMEAALANLVEPGDAVLVGVNGYFGGRIAEMALRYGAEVRTLERAWGEAFDPAEFEAALRQRPAKVVALVHAETSAGVLQPGLAEIARIVHEHGGLLLVDCVTSLGGVPVEIDAWEVDVAYSGTQKCLACPPGLAPLTFSARAYQAIQRRKTRPSNWYLDVLALERYWGPEHVYHHTAPISLHYGLREGLRVIVEEGLENRFARHRANAERLWAGLEAMGLTLHVPNACRLPTLTTVRVPEDVDEAEVRRRLLNEYHIEIGAGLGALKGRVWRIGLMGHGSQHQNVVLLLSALAEILGRPRPFSS